jgi:hypothetical protein
MLHRRAIRFGRADTFEDRYEGLLPPRAPKRWRGVFEQLSKQRRCAYVSCWHANEVESVGMWKAFSALEPGVAIQTSVGRLHAALDGRPETIFLGGVRYVDFDAEQLSIWERAPSAIDPLMHKRKQFEYEQEVRAMLDLASDLSQRAARDEKSGVTVEVDLGTLIESVHTAPGSENWFVDVVASALDRYGVNVPVERSRLDDVPEGWRDEVVRGKGQVGEVGLCSHGRERVFSASRGPTKDAPAHAGGSHAFPTCPLPLITSFPA